MHVTFATASRHRDANHCVLCTRCRRPSQPSRPAQPLSSAALSWLRHLLSPRVALLTHGSPVLWLPPEAEGLLAWSLGLRSAVPPGSQRLRALRDHAQSFGPRSSVRALSIKSVIGLGLRTFVLSADSVSCADCVCTSARGSTRAYNSVRVSRRLAAGSAPHFHASI